MFMSVVEDSSSIPDEMEVLASPPDRERTLERWADDKSGRETLLEKGMERDRSGVAFHSPPRNFETSVRKFWSNGLRPWFQTSNLINVELKTVAVNIRQTITNRFC